MQMTTLRLYKFLALVASLLGGVHAAAPPPPPPLSLDRMLVVGAARITTTLYLDPGAKIGTLEDSVLWGYGMELSLLCRSTWGTSWTAFAHLPLVDTPNVWYIPLATPLGSWPYQQGDSLLCELWECDGGGGCDPAVPAVLPNATTGDDFLGSALLTMAAYKPDYSYTLNFFLNGTQTGTLYMECSNCAALWARPGGWVNPYPPPPPAPTAAPAQPPAPTAAPAQPPAPTTSPAQPPAPTAAPAQPPALPANGGSSPASSWPPPPASSGAPGIPPPASSGAPGMPPPASSGATGIPPPAVQTPALPPARPLPQPPLPSPPAPGVSAFDGPPDSSSSPPVSPPALPLPPAPAVPGGSGDGDVASSAPPPPAAASSSLLPPVGDALQRSSPPPGSPAASGQAASSPPQAPPPASPIAPPPSSSVLAQAINKASKTAKGVLVGVTVAVAFLVTALLLSLGFCLVRRWRRRQVADQEPPEDSFGGIPAVPTVLHLRVDKPADADAAMRALGAPAAMVTTPWRPSGA
ncbi:hypothetical protein ABPG77_007599 [Micractinium sp. CCAP 211/92]